MAKSRHFHKRMGQRGVTQRMVQLVTDYGVADDGDKLILDCKHIDELISGMDKLRGDLLKLRDKGGLVLVEANDTLITAYRANSYQRPHVA